MLRVPHRISIRRLLGRDTVLVRGYEYVQDLSGSFQPNQQYVWSVSAAPAGGLTQPVESPGNLTVLSPKGGTIVPRDRDLDLTWQGTGGRISIVISSFDPLTRRSRPLIELRLRANTGRALLPAKLLRQLPAYQKHFVFTFLLAQRQENVVVQQYSGKILVQAAAVYNSYIELR